MKLVRGVMWSLACCSLVFLLGFTGREQQNRKCQGLKISIADNTGNYFIEPADISGMLNNKAIRVKATDMGEIDLGLLEKIVYTNPYVKRAEVYATIDGFVHIDVWQRNPVLRIVNTMGEHFYMDEEGNFMPVTDKFTSPVPVATGFINFKPSVQNPASKIAEPSVTSVKPLMQQLGEIAFFLRNNDFWDAQTEQIYVNENSEIELVPRVGNHTILLGDSEHLDEKMSNLFIFYRDGLVKTGWDKYSVINLKYRDQVVCTRAANYKRNS